MNRGLKIFAAFLSCYFIIITTTPGVAGIVGSINSSSIHAESVRDQEVTTVKKALELKIVQEKLRAYGLTEQEVNEKIKKMSDKQVHMLAQASEKVLAGGDGLGLIITVLVIVVLVLLILRLA